MVHSVEYSGSGMQEALERNLEELDVLRYDSGYREALGQSFSDRLARWKSSIARCKESPFTIVVIGDFKRGKSTLINALLEEEAATMDVTTETVTLNRISYGAPGNEAVLSGGRSVRLADSELKREKLEEIMNELGEPIRRLEIRRHCGILKKVTIIDTPGTGDAMRDFADVVKESLLQADAVIYVYNVQYPLSRSEQIFLKVAVLPQKYTSLFLVGNFSDILETKEAYEKMEGMLKQRIKNLLPGAESYMVSALDELCIRLGEETVETELTPVLRGRFNDLRKDLEECIRSRSEHVVLDRMQRLTMAMVRELEAELDALETGLRMDMEEVDAVLLEAEKEREKRIEGNAEIIKDIDQVIRKMKTETNAWMGDFMQRIIREAEQLKAVSDDDLKRYYEFYCVDLMQEAMDTCVAYHRERLLDLMDSATEGMGREAADGLYTEKTYYFRINLDNRIWTKGDTVGLVTSGIASANYLTYVASLAADGISGLMREKEKQERTPELVAQISRKLLNLGAMVSDTVDAVYGELCDKAQKLFADHFEEETAQKQCLLEQTVRAAAKSMEEKKSMKQAVERARKILDRVKADEYYALQQCGRNTDDSVLF